MLKIDLINNFLKFRFLVSALFFVSIFKIYEKMTNFLFKEY